MYNRQMTSELKQAAKDYPVVTLTGPRQAGKTTLVKLVFPNKNYVNLENPDTRELAISDPRGFLSQFPDGAIIDEIQNFPKLLSYIQGIVDEKKEPGMFILTGSHQLQLHHAISQSLAGRTALLTLFPMSLAELTEAGIEMSLDEVLLNGGYPRIFNDHLDPTKAYRSYYQTYLERDLRELIHIKDLSQFQKFIRLCAGRIGQLLNLEGLGNEVGISGNTVKHWISILEASYIIIRLQPYYENFGKRLIKTAKLYFTDVGLATYLLGIDNVTQVSRDPLRGHLVENLVILELIKYRLNEGKDPNLYFYRDAQDHEVDILFQSGHDLIPIEVKSAMTFDKSLLKNLSFFRSLVGERCKKGYLIYSGTQEQKIGSFNLLNYKNVTEIFN